MKVFVAHSVRDRELVSSVATLLREDGHNVFIPVDIVTTGNLLSEISAAIRSADVLVAVLTGGNPNVFYELGLAAGAGVPTLITAQAGDLLPADLVTVPYVQLSGDLPRDAQAIVRRVKDLEGLSRVRLEKFSSAEAALQAASRDPAVLEALAPAEFERLVAEFFKERGYEVSTTSPTRDAGVDLFITSPKDDKVLLVEVKKLSRQSRVSVEAVRRLWGAVSSIGAPLGMLVSTSGYTAAALALAAGSPILLRTLEDILAAKSKRELIKPLTEPIKNPHHGREVILLVEDEASVRDMAREILQSRGYRVVESGNGVEAFEVASQTTTIDLVLTDVVMPDMDGRELAERLKAVRPSVKILFMTSYTDDAVLTHGLHADRIALLQKPFTPQGLLRAVREVLD